MANINDSNYPKEVWHIIDELFKQNNNNLLVRHQIEPFNQFLDSYLNDIIKQANPVIIYNDFSKENNKHRTELHMEFLNYTLAKPLLYENDASYRVMTPEMARLRQQSYMGQLSINIRLKAITRSGEYLEKEDIREMEIKNVNFGNIPYMVRSKYCVLHGLDKANIGSAGECKYDVGGYFIISGSEKVIISQEKIADNKVFVFNHQKQTHSIDCDIKSMADNLFVPAVSNSVKYVFKDNIIVVSLQNFRIPLNLFIALRLLGLNTDKELINSVVADTDNEQMRQYLELLLPTMTAYKALCTENKLQTRRDFLLYAVKYYQVRGSTTNKEIVMTPETRINHMLKSFEQRILPHLGRHMIKKAYFFGYMTYRLLSVHLGNHAYDDRDSYMNKRVETSGILLGGLFRQYFNKQIEETKKNIIKELNRNKKIKKDVFDIINVNNIYKIIKSTVITSGLKYSMATGNWSVKMIANSAQKMRIGIAQVLNRISNQGCLSHLRRVNSPAEKCNGKIIFPRKLHNSQWGYICPAETPEGAVVGLVKNMALASHITISMSSHPVREWLIKNGVIEFAPCPETLFEYDETIIHPPPCIYKNNFTAADMLYNAKIFVNGDWMGIHRNPISLIGLFKIARAMGIINIFTSITWNTMKNEINIYTDAGRITRPLLCVGEDNKLALTDGDIAKGKKYGWDYFLNPSIFDGNPRRLIEYIDCEETNSVSVAMFPRDLLSKYNNQMIKTYTNCEIHAGLVLGAVAAVIPFPNRNQSPRNTYQSAMSKQSICISSMNFDRIDTLNYFSHTLEFPLVSTRFSKYVLYDKMPNGTNAIVAIMSYSGFNQDDSVILNRSFIERGGFGGTLYRAYKDDEKKDTKTSLEEKFCIPNPEITKSMKPCNYSKLGADGIIKLNTYVGQNDVIIGKVLPLEKTNSKILYRDCSTTMRINEEGYVDKIYIGKNADGYKFVKLRIRTDRVPEIGDKFASRCGQKGTCGIILPPEQMPMLPDGTCPDIIMNPHAIPSRMTIGQLMECLLAKSAVVSGGLADCSIFNDVEPDKIGDLLEDAGYNRNCNEFLYNGITGEQMPCEIFVGPTYYQRLKHMVADKVHSRSSGPIVLLTRQPAEGRSRDGGLRCGEMERDVMISHGIVSFLRERMMDVSDKFQLWICSKCRLYAVVNTTLDEPLFKCKCSDECPSFDKINVPYVLSLINQEIFALLMKMKIKTK